MLVAWVSLGNGSYYRVFFMVRYLLAWFPMLVIAVANGALRQFTFAKLMPEPQAHQLSTLTGAVLIGFFIWAVVRIWPPASGRKALLIGICWVLLTATFETWMGLSLQQRSWPEVLHEYNLGAGRVWSLFLLWLGGAPWIFLRLGRARPNGPQTARVGI